MTPAERATLAAIQHYDQRIRASLRLLQLADPHAPDYAAAAAALELLDRARRAELLDPEPAPSRWSFPQ